MAHAAIDLPDNPNLPSVDNADDLLSQLAGDEIDRLLSEAAIEPEKPAVETVATKSPAAVSAPVADETEVSEQINELLSGLDAPAGADASGQDSAASARQGDETNLAEGDLKSDSPEGEERAALLNAAGFSGDQKEAESISATLARSLDGPDADPGNPAPEGTERTALLEAAGFESASTTDVGAESMASEQSTQADLLEEAFENSESDEEDRPLPFFLKPLEWINAPLANATPMIRQMIGWTAIGTILTSVTFISYVIICRKH